MTYKDGVRIGIWISFWLAYNHNKLQSLRISSSTNFALELALMIELEFLCDQLSLELLNS
jgi:hypothetical protein